MFISSFSEASNPFGKLQQTFANGKLDLLLHNPELQKWGHGGQRLLWVWGLLLGCLIPGVHLLGGTKESLFKGINDSYI